MQGEVVSNRLHRSGAIDHNATFNIRQAQVQNAKKGFHGKKFWSQTEHADAYSVCEGEPCFTVSNKKQKPLAADRNPVALLSSLNGFCPGNSKQISDAIRQCAEAGETEVEQLRAYHNLRNEFFREICYSSTAVSKFDYGSVGRKGEQFVATMGGLNTIYTDTPLAAGDVVVADIPAFDAESLENGNYRMATADCDAADCKQYGLVTWKQKKGVPKSKRTLVIRGIPAMPVIRDDGTVNGKLAADEKRNAYETFRQGFLARGQVVGKCVNAASAGERIDLTHVGNAIGVWNSCCNNFPII